MKEKERTIKVTQLKQIGLLMTLTWWTLRKTRLKKTIMLKEGPNSTNSTTSLLSMNLLKLLKVTTRNHCLLITMKEAILASEI